MTSCSMSYIRSQNPSKRCATLSFSSSLTTGRCQGSMLKAQREPGSGLKAPLQRSLRQETRKSSPVAVEQLELMQSLLTQEANPRSPSLSRPRKRQLAKMTTRKNSTSSLTRTMMTPKRYLSQMPSSSRNPLSVRKTMRAIRSRRKARRRMKTMRTMKMTRRRTTSMRRRC